MNNHLPKHLLTEWLLIDPRPWNRRNSLDHEVPTWTSKEQGTPRQGTTEGPHLDHEIGITPINKRSAHDHEIGRNKEKNKKDKGALNRRESYLFPASWKPYPTIKALFISSPILPVYYLLKASLLPIESRKGMFMRKASHSWASIYRTLICRTSIYHQGLSCRSYIWVITRKKAAKVELECPLP